ncbi:MAG TPA: hypothetical protein EYQ46_03020 [Myxococcales bacterium]|nr:hypothetical protein [Myxococcales bacterium]
MSIIFKSMILRSLTIEDETDAVRAHALLAPEEFPFLFDFEPGDDFVAYVARVDAFNAGGQFSKGGVPGAFLIAVIERAGGHFDKRVDGDGSGPKRHYWFETSNLGATASS